MTNDQWAKINPREWRYTNDASGGWVPDSAHIVLRGKEDWALYINANFIGTFPTWKEARDVTPMMLALHGFNT